MKTKISFQAAMAVFLGFICLLIAVRIFYTGSNLFLFLIWNIFLAWIPFAISSSFKTISKAAYWKKLIAFCTWLVFFPNSLYIVTDLVHLQTESNMPKWFDAVLLFAASAAGLIMAFVSLYRAEACLIPVKYRSKSSLLIFLVLFVSSFGVYLGRFLRWNSWDIISNPFQLLFSIGRRIAYPHEHIQTWTVTCTLTIFFYLLYIALKKMPGYISRANEQL